MAGEFGALQSDTAHLVLERHLDDDDVRIVTPRVQQVEQAADAADAHMSVGKMEMMSWAAAKMTNSAAAGESIGAEIWTVRKDGTRIVCLEHPCQSSQTSSQVTAPIQVSSLT